MNNKVKGLLAYIFGCLGGLIVIFGFKDNDRKTVLHAYQSIVISISVIVLSVAVSFINIFISAVIGFDFSVLSLGVNILQVVFMILGIFKVVNNDPEPKLPIIGDLTMNLFGKAINAVPESVVPAGAAPRFDPNTGRPINPQPQANFDPNTGRPINSQPINPQPVNPQPQANFDPNTGQPLTSPVTAPQTTPMDQNTI